MRSFWRTATLSQADLDDHDLAIDERLVLTSLLQAVLAHQIRAKATAAPSAES